MKKDFDCIGATQTKINVACLGLESGPRLESDINLGRKRTTEDDKHPGSDHPQCQHRKVGLA